MLTETLVEKTKKIEKISFAIFIINKLKNKKVLGLTTTEWLKKEFVGLPLYIIDNNNDDNIKEKIKPYAINYDYIFIINNNTPFITKNLIDNIMEYIWFKNSLACKLYLGAVYKTSYYLATNEINYDNFYMQNQEQFAIVETEEQVAMAEKYFSKKIILENQKKGVMFENPNSVILSPFCEIGKGTTIFSNCVIKGKTKIGSNAIINNNTTIIDSTIGNNTSMSNSNITKCKIGNNVIISPYCTINKSKIADNCFIEGYCLIDNFSVNKNELIKARTTLQKEKN